MKVNLSTPILDHKGQPAVDEQEKQISAKDVIVQAILMGGRAENKSEEEKYKQYVLLTSISESSGEVDLKAEDIVMIKKLVNEVYPALVYGRVRDLIDK